MPRWNPEAVARRREFDDWLALPDPPDDVSDDALNDQFDAMLSRHLAEEPVDLENFEEFVSIAMIMPIVMDDVPESWEYVAAVERVYAVTLSVHPSPDGDEILVQRVDPDPRLN